MNTTTNPHLGRWLPTMEDLMLTFFFEAHACNLERMTCSFCIYVLPFLSFLSEQAFICSIHPSGSVMRAILSRRIGYFLRQITITFLVRLLLGFQKNHDSFVRELLPTVIAFFQKKKNLRRSRSLSVVTCKARRYLFDL